MVQIGFKPWLQMWVDTGIKTPMQSTPPALSNRVANIPKAPMMSYDVKGTILPWVSDDKAKKIVEIVNYKAKSEEEKKAMLQDAHEQAVKLEQQAAFKKDREVMKQELIARIGKTSDPKEQGQLQTQVKLSTFADLIRDGAKKEWVNIDINDDQELITKHLEANQHLQPIFKDYIEWKKSTTDLLPDMGLWVKEEVPVEKETTWSIGEVVPLARWAMAIGGWVMWAVKWAYEWIVPWFKEMVTDSKRILNDPNKSAPEKFNQILFGELWANYLGGIIWDTIWWLMGWVYEWFTTETERKAIWDKVKWVFEDMVWVAKTNPDINWIMIKYNKLDGYEKQELNDLLWYAVDAANFIWVEQLGKPMLQWAEWLLNKWATVLDRTMWGATNKLEKWMMNIAGKVWEIAPVDAAAKFITKTSSAQGKLFKAQNPTLNVLNKNRNFKTIRAESDLANQLIADAGHTPIDTETRRIAHEATMTSKWAEIENAIQNKKDLRMSQSKFADIIEKEVLEAKKSWLVKNKADIQALEAEAKALREQGMVDLPTLEKKKQMINGIVNNRGDSAIGDVYKNAMKKVTRAIGEAEDAALANIPWEFSKVKKEFWALKSTYEDVLKADIKNQKAKGMNIMESYSRIEGIGDIIWWALSIFSKGWEWVKDVAKGAWKLFMGKALKRATDSDFLIEQWFKELTAWKSNIIQAP